MHSKNAQLSELVCHVIIEHSDIAGKHSSYGIDKMTSRKRYVSSATRVGVNATCFDHDWQRRAHVRAVYEHAFQFKVLAGRSLVLQPTGAHDTAHKSRCEIMPGDHG